MQPFVGFFPTKFSASVMESVALVEALKISYPVIPKEKRELLFSTNM